MNETRRVGLEDLKRILVDRVGLPAEDIPDDLTTTFDELGLDSLAFMEISLAVEQEYGLQVDEEDAERITTLGEALDYVNSRLAEEASA
ncbi:MAG TPA: acyl carrier protein [Solirubrobacteraceae bacterium]|nr:acyl carrier protein [Solirubrobacteraceae bacterium]